jgi:hypothetical protein
MRKCPVCNNWSLDFDEYFGRFRCFDCGWMPPSATEREIQRLRSFQEPIDIDKIHIEEIGLNITSKYDKVNDALIFDFGLNEPSFELPEDDGRVIWKISHCSGSVTGLVILDARKTGVSEVQIKITASKDDVERRIKTMPDAIATGRATKILIENVTITARTKDPSTLPTSTPFYNAIEQAVKKFRSSYGSVEGPQVQV